MTEKVSTPEEIASVSPEALRTLVDNHGRFLAFLSRRVASREVAEEILQGAFVRGLERLSTIRADEAVTAWFYRVLRNAIVDHYRHEGAKQRALGKVAIEASAAVEPGIDAELMGAVCTCVMSLLSTIKVEYAEMVRRVDLEGASVKDLAAELGITANNASVRLHRAREAMRHQLSRSCGACATHGCLECHCKKSANGGAHS